MSPYILVVAIVPRNKGELIAHSAIQAGSGGGTILLGRGTASNKVLQILGIGDTGRDIFLTIVDSATRHSIITSIKHSATKARLSYGIVFSMDVLSLSHGSIDRGGQSTMSIKEGTRYRLITLIINKGFADDAMATARAAGARGGTIVNARGTARVEDAKVFGVHIVPEKEMLLLIVEESKASAVYSAVSSLECLKEKGSGIVYSSALEDFSLLGRGA